MAIVELPSLGDHIRDARLHRGFSLRALAGEVGVSASMISQIENGKSQPSVSTLYAITESPLPELACTSTNRPSPVITTFRSTSAFESSE